jgi:pimeloyl-ACP methyl ester carboxylesterase
LSDLGHCRRLGCCQFESFDHQKCAPIRCHSREGGLIGCGAKKDAVTFSVLSQSGGLPTVVPKKADDQHYKKLTEIALPPSRREVLVSAAALASFSAEGTIPAPNKKTAASSPAAGMAASRPSPERSIRGSAMTDDGVRLYFEETGSGVPIVFVHEFAGDHRSWEPQVRFLSRWFRCITFNARGYPPSDVPEDVTRYSQARARDDIRDVLAHLHVERAHIIGLSMGGFATLHFGLAYPSRALSLLIVSCGYGANPDRQVEFQAEMEATAARIERESMAEFAKSYALGPARVQLQNKDPRRWNEFATQLADHSTRGSALTMRGVQKQRPSLWSLRGSMRNMSVPTLIMAGDEDEPCLEPALMMKRTISTAGLAVIPRSGHAINLEDPDEFNRLAHGFITAAETGRWSPRDRRAVFPSTRE